MPFGTGTACRTAVILDPEHENRDFEIDATSRAARINAGDPHGFLDPGVVFDPAICPARAALIFTRR
jgi:hypothetical protein